MWHHSVQMVGHMACRKFDCLGFTPYQQYFSYLKDDSSQIHLAWTILSPVLNLPIILTLVGQS